jgi:GNAT superfamily N-acetyltransferase
MTPKFFVRAAHQSDVPFLTSTWLKSARDAFHYRGIPNTVYYDNMHFILEQVLPRATVLVACDPDAVNVVYGYVVGEVIDGCLTIHYCYVKKAWRRMGILSLLFRRLLEHERDFGRYFQVTHRSKAFKRFFDSRQVDGLIPAQWEYTYNPFLLYSTVDWTAE